jgi:hypothetical protein
MTTVVLVVAVVQKTEDGCGIPVVPNAPKDWYSFQNQHGIDLCVEKKKKMMSNIDYYHIVVDVVDDNFDDAPWWMAMVDRKSADTDPLLRVVDDDWTDTCRNDWRQRQHSFQMLSTQLSPDLPISPIAKQNPF